MLAGQVVAQEVVAGRGAINTRFFFALRGLAVVWRGGIPGNSKAADISSQSRHSHVGSNQGPKGQNDENQA